MRIKRKLLCFALLASKQKSKQMNLLVPSNLKIITMTIITDIPTNTIAYFLEQIEKNKESFLTSDGYKPTYNFAGEKSFGNCILCKWQRSNKSRGCVKIFKNKLHMTGVKSEEEAREQHQCFVKMLYPPDNIAFSPKVKIVMINNCFSVNKDQILNLDLYKIHDISHISGSLPSCVSRTVFDLNQHPSLKFYVRGPLSNKDIAVFFFSSGKALITGANNMSDVNFIYDTMITWFFSIAHMIDIVAKPIVEKDKNKKRGRKRKLDSSSFYDEMVL